MSEPCIHFFVEDLEDFSFDQKESAVNWLNLVAKSENQLLESINYVFCSDEYLLEINRQYLNHDYYTDIITFPLSEGNTPIEADIFVSVDRVTENAKTLGQDLDSELSRVLVHGLLHLLGYGDATDEEKVQMRTKEDFYLAMK